MDLYAELLNLTPILMKETKKRDLLIKMAEICKELEKVLKCPQNPHLKTLLQCEVSNQSIDYAAKLKELLLYYKPYLSIFQIMNSIYLDLIENLANRTESEKILENIHVIQQESTLRSEIKSIQQSMTNLDHFLNSQYTDTLSRQSSINPYQLRYTISQYKDKKASEESLKKKINDMCLFLETRRKEWEMELEKIEKDRHKEHIEKLIYIYQKTNIQRVELKSLEDDLSPVHNEPISVNLVDPHAQPSPKLIQRFSFSMPEVEIEFADVMDELQIVHATDTVTAVDKKPINNRAKSINHLEQYLEFKKADMLSIPEQDLHLELMTKVKK